MTTPRPLARHTLVGSEGRRLYVYGALDGSIGPGWPHVEAGALQQRLDRLTGTWIALSPARNARPHASDATATASDAAATGCPLCPGGPEIPFPYRAAAFENRFPAFLEQPPAVPDDRRIAPSAGRCEVVLYTDRHVGSLATLEPDALARVVAVWRDRTHELWADPRHRYVMAFENRGEGVGATLTHPHGQIYAFDHVPPFIARRVDALAEGRARADRCVTCEVVEDDGRERLLDRAGSFVVAVPFAPRWPYEVHVRTTRHGLRRLDDMTPDDAVALAGLLRRVVLRYDRLFGFELPYMMTILEAPAGVDDWHLAVEFLPPNRNERLTKVRASVETATGLFINDSLPEVVAARLAGIAVPAVSEAAPMEVVGDAD